MTVDTFATPSIETTGRDRSRLNAVKHGLAGIGGTLSGRDPALESRLELWVAEIKPGNEEGLFALRQAVAETFRIESCREALAAAKSLRKGRASTPEGWDVDRRAAAARLVQGLHKRPETTVRQLEATKQGAEVLLAHWNRLGYALDENKGWTESELSSAHDLLAVPLHLRESGSPFTPWNGCNEFDHRRKVAMDEALRLEALVKHTLGPIDELERDQAASGVSFLSSKEASLILRYERDALRRHAQFLAIAKASRLEVEDVVPKAEETSEADPDAEPIEAIASKPAPMSRAERRRQGRPPYRTLPRKELSPAAIAELERAGLSSLLK